ncbi:MAG TPA: hypothetical protein VGB49_09295 [Caulobacteraceae bacterium]
MSDQNLDPHSRAAEARLQGAPVEAQYARQGRKGWRVLLILAVSFILAGIVMGFIWMLYSGRMAAVEPGNARQGSDAARFDAPASPGAKMAPEPDAPSPVADQRSRNPAPANP